MKPDRTHDPELQSWVESAQGSEFPIQNLPFCVFRSRKGPPRGGVGIGDQILDLEALGLRTGPTLNGVAAMGPAKWKALRKEISRLLSKKAFHPKTKKFLTPAKQAELFLPVAIGDYSDFFTGIHHASNMGRMLRPGNDNPLLPNYKWVPIAYHGRASSIVVSGTPVVRPRGQSKAPDQPSPSFGPTRRLDYEAELGFLMGPGNALSKSISIEKAKNHLFGVVLLNDWSARDLQAWEYVPLGPFLAKSFASTVSPWIVTMEALEPFRCPAFPRGAEDPKPLPYLFDEADQREGGIDITIEMHLRTARMESPVRLSRGNFRDAYWTPAQMVAHQSSNGCNLQPGDLLGSGTLSGDTPGSAGSMMELTLGGKSPVSLPGGEARGFLEDGDEVIETAHCSRPGFARIGFGTARGTIKPANA